VHGAQAVGCSPVAEAFLKGVEHVRPQKPSTIAKSLAIGNPADGFYALKAVRETGGAIDMVDDDEIVDSILLLARTEGIFTETAGGVTVGVLSKLAKAGTFEPGERVVAFITGMGLKTLEAVVERAKPTATIPPTLEEFEHQIEIGVIPRGNS
jgi:threonine synthase